LSTGNRVRTNAAIVATGRAGGGLGLPYLREYLDNNVAVAARLSSPGGHLETRTMIEAVPGGWFYLAALPDKEVIVVFITLATLVPSERRVRLRWWLEALAQTTMVRNTLNGHRLPETLTVANARASFARSGAGDHWLAIGDARIAPDPLSGQGIIWAIDDAVAVMELLTRMGWRDLIQHMRARTANEVNAYCLERSRVYLSEQRFKNDAYWSAIPDHLRLNEIGPLAPEN
jgi:2-polyprenyl-6-methoxyphenol hydroxylase-like FAD-dependent oxidoreductase